MRRTLRPGAMSSPRRRSSAAAAEWVAWPHGWKPRGDTFRRGIAGNDCDGRGLMPGIGLKVFPSKVANHHADVLIANSVLTAKRVAGLGSTGIGGTGGVHIQGRKFCVIVLLAARGG